MSENLTTREVLEVARRLNLDLQPDKLKSWLRPERGIIADADRPGKGGDREWPLPLVIRVIVLAYLSPHAAPQVLASWATSIAQAITEIFEAGVTGDRVEAVEPVGLKIDSYGSIELVQLGQPGRRTAKEIASLYPWHVVVPIDIGHMALSLSGELEKIVAERPRD